MFEDSTFESNGTIRTRSRGWMLAALTLNSTILIALVLIPLVYPEALPRQAMSIVMEVPPPPAAPTPPQQHRALRSTSAPSEMTIESIVAPRRIPNIISTVKGPGYAVFNIASTWEPSDGVIGGDGPFQSQPAPRVIHPDVPKSIRVPSTIATGLLLRKVVPQYPQLAKAMRAEGTVALAATIAKDGTIVNLRVVSGPAVLQQAALDAVRQWLYRPYLLNGEPVEVETSVNVIFTLGG
jgi:protein TonB